MAKRKLTLWIEESKIREFKHKALDAGIPVSQFLTNAGSIVSTDSNQHSTPTISEPDAQTVTPKENDGIK